MKKWWDGEVSSNFDDSLLLGIVIFLFGTGVILMIILLTAVCKAA